MIAFKEPLKDQMAALNEAQIGVVCLRLGLAQNRIDPRPCGIDDFARGDRAYPVFILKRGGPMLAPTLKRGAFGACANIRPALFRIDTSEHHQPRIINPAIGIFKPCAEPFLQKPIMRCCAQIHRPGGRQEFAAANMVV